jgi:hypothetical protein
VIDRPIDENTNEPVVKTGDADATRPETTNKPVVTTGDDDATRPDEADLVVSPSEKPTNESDVGDESSASYVQLSLSAADDLPAGDVDDRPIDENTNKPVVKTGHDDATRPETANKPVARTGDDDATRPDEADLVAAPSEKPTNESDVGDESSASSVQLSFSAEDAVPAGDGSQGVKSVSGSSTATALPSVRSNMAFGDAKEQAKRAKAARSNRAVYLKEMKEQKKREREAEKKKEEEERAAVRAEKKGSG